MKLLPIIAFLFLAVQCYCQSSSNKYNQKRLTPTFIDTTNENIFIYEVANAIIYFRQNDILDFINNSDKSLNRSFFQPLQDTLKQHTRKILVKDISYSYSKVERDSILKNETIAPEMQTMNDIFYSICADLMFSGRFMVYSKESKKIESVKLKAKRKKGYLGAQYLNFYLPNKKVFYSIVTRFGE